MRLFLLATASALALSSAASAGERPKLKLTPMPLFKVADAPACTPARAGAVIGFSDVLGAMTPGQIDFKGGGHSVELSICNGTAWELR